MKFKYRVQGKVKTAFVVRGLLFRDNSRIDFCVDESEIEFVKSNCYQLNITDLDPVLEIQPQVEVKSEPVVKPKEIKKESEENELHTRPRSPKNGNTKKSQSKVSLPVRK